MAAATVSQSLPAWSTEVSSTVPASMPSQSSSASTPTTFTSGSPSRFIAENPRNVTANSTATSSTSRRIANLATSPYRPDGRGALADTRTN